MVELYPHVVCSMLYLECGMLGFVCLVYCTIWPMDADYGSIGVRPPLQFPSLVLILSFLSWGSVSPVVSEILGARSFIRA